jgi:hypothetical protein
MLTATVASGIAATRRVVSLKPPRNLFLYIPNIVAWVRYFLEAFDRYRLYAVLVTVPVTSTSL